MQQLIDKFVEFLRFEKSGGLSENTINRYLLNLRHLTIESGKNLFDIKTYPELAQYLRDLRAKHKWSPSTTKNAADTYSVFYNWAFRYGYIQDSPMRLGHEFKNREKRQMDFFDWESDEFKRLIYNPNNSTRDNAILHVLRSSGLRAGGVCGLKIKDVDLIERWLFVNIIKGGGYRYVPFDQETGEWLSLYMPQIQRQSKLDWLFQNEDFTRPLTPATLYKLIVRKAAKLGIHAYPQKFRRSLGGELIGKGADLTVVQQVLGHKRASTTADYYVYFKKEKLKEQYDKFVISPQTLAK